MATEFTGIVLAGGRSSRMGRDKAALPWAGGTLLDRMIELLRVAGARHVLVSGERPMHGGIPDAWPSRGPVAGLASVLPRCMDRVAVVVPVDLPLLDFARIRVLADVAAVQAAACFHAHPLPCAFRIDTAARGAFDELMQALDEGPSMRRLLSMLGAIELDPGDARDLRPCNTPADWAALTP